MAANGSAPGHGYSPLVPYTAVLAQAPFCDWRVEALNCDPSNFVYITKILTFALSIPTFLLFLLVFYLRYKVQRLPLFQPWGPGPVDSIVYGLLAFSLLRGIDSVLLVWPPGNYGFVGREIVMAVSWEPFMYACYFHLNGLVQMTPHSFISSESAVLTHLSKRVKHVAYTLPLLTTLIDIALCVVSGIYMDSAVRRFAVEGQGVESAGVRADVATYGGLVMARFTFHWVAYGVMAVMFFFVCRRLVYILTENLKQVEEKIDKKKARALRRKIASVRMTLSTIWMSVPAFVVTLAFYAYARTDLLMRIEGLFRFYVAWWDPITMFSVAWIGAWFLVSELKRLKSSKKGESSSDLDGSTSATSASASASTASQMDQMGKSSLSVKKGASFLESAASARQSTPLSSIVVSVDDKDGA